jgi:hypothetical protein
MVAVLLYDGQIQLQVLPPHAFPNGKHYFEHRAQVWDLPYIVHNNHLRTKTLKEERLKEHGMWYENEADFLSVLAAHAQPSVLPPPYFSEKRVSSSQALPSRGLVEYDFIEIGTSDFETLLQEADDTTVGISLEPMAEYLDRLPNRTRVQKVNKAILIDESTPFTTLYYVPPHTIETKKLPWWIKGCNSIGKPHAKHHQYQEHVKRVVVPTITPQALLSEFMVGGIGLLKTDLEGYDYLILHAFLDLLENEQTKLDAPWPSVVLYEDEHGTVAQKQNLEARFQRLGYMVQSRTTKDVVMQRVCVPREAGSAMESWCEKSTARAMQLLEKSAATNQRCNVHRVRYYTHHTPLPAGC